MLSKNHPAYTLRPFYYPEPTQPLHCEKTSLAALARKFGTPLYVYSAGQILERYELFAKTFSARDHLICYSVKANSNLSLLKLLADKGSGFDIVSGGELERILTVSRKAARRVVFSGVGKTAAEIDLALSARILIFNVESESELDLLAERARKRQVRASVALRVNPDVFAETHPYISTGLREHKFGIDMRIARSVYQKASRSRFLEPVGVSVHIGSQIQTAEPFRAALEAVAALIRELQSDGIRIKFVDAGGGLGIDYHHALEDASGLDPAAAVAGYAAAVEGPLQGLGVKLLLEPGRFLVAQAGALVTRVLNVKRNGEKTFVIVDAGMNDLIRPALYQAHHEILPIVEDGTGETAAVDVVGPVCETGDFFARDRTLPVVKAGELVAILDTGAYGMSQSSNYNSRPRPAEVLVAGKKARLIRKRESMRDLMRAEMGFV